MVSDDDLATLAKAGERLCGHAAKAPAAAAMAKRSDLAILLDASISFDRACAEIADRQWRGSPAAQSTIDALMYSLRAGCAALSRQDVQQRLAAVDEKQLHDICSRLQKLKPRIAKWQPNDVEHLVIMWAARHGE